MASSDKSPCVVEKGKVDFNQCKENAEVHTWCILGPLPFLVFINDLPKFVKDKSVPILFADDTSILLSHSNTTDFNNNINTVFKILNDWFRQNLLSFNFSKTQFTNFISKKHKFIEININYDNSIPLTTYTKFLGLTVDFSLTWINHLDSLIKKLSTTCYFELTNKKPKNSTHHVKNKFQVSCSINLERFLYYIF
jgi:hypothetical protein